MTTRNYIRIRFTALFLLLSIYLTFRTHTHTKNNERDEEQRLLRNNTIIIYLEHQHVYVLYIYNVSERVTVGRHRSKRYILYFICDTHFLPRPCATFAYNNNHVQKSPHGRRKADEGRATREYSMQLVKYQMDWNHVYGTT